MFSGNSTRRGVKLGDVMQLISGPALGRKREEIERVTDWIRKKSALFADLDKEIVNNVIKYCKCQISLKDTVVVKQGDRGNAFYVILHGKVSVFVKQDEEKLDPIGARIKALLESDAESEAESESVIDSEPELEMKPEKLTQKRFKTILPILRVSQVAKNIKSKAQQKPKVDPRQSLGLRVAQYADGDTFGELALQRKDNKRAASVVTDSDVVFLVVERELYNKSIKSFQTKELAMIRSFIERNPLFRGWPPRLQMQIQNCVMKIKEGPGKIILKQGQPCDGIHFIIDGEIGVTVNTEHHDALAISSNKTTLVPQNDVKKSQNEILQSLSTQQIQIKRLEGYAAAESFHQNKNKELCLSGPTLMIGDIEYVLGLQTYIQSIKTLNNTVLFQISKDNLSRIFKLVSQQNPPLHASTLSAMKEIVIEKWNTRFKASNCDLSSIKALLQQMEQDYEKSTSKDLTVALTREEKMFKYLIKAYIDDQAPLINPITEDSHYVRMLTKHKAKLRKRRETRDSLVNLPSKHFKLIATDKKPRSIARLKDAIKSHQTSDVDIIIPKRERSYTRLFLPAIEQIPTLSKESIDTDVQDNAQRPISAPLMTEPNSTVISFDLKTTSEHQKTKTKLPLVKGKTLSFFSQHLEGLLEKEYEKYSVNPVITENNKHADCLEEKIMQFNTFYASKNTIVNWKLKRMDETTVSSIIPGGKCYAIKMPCRVHALGLTSSTHQHVRHSMITDNVHQDIPKITNISQHYKQA